MILSECPLLGAAGSCVLYHVVNDRHLRKRPMIFTTNKPLNEWGKVLHDEDMAAAILDRVIAASLYITNPNNKTSNKTSLEAAMSPELN